MSYEVKPYFLGKIIWLFMDIVNFLQEIKNKKTVIYALAKRDFQAQYMGSYLGFVWVFLQPLIFMGVLYFIFTVGFRAKPSGDTPFAVYLVSGMIAWLFFAESFNASTNVISQHAFMIKKVNFRLGILPIVKLLSSLVPHTVFILIGIIVALLNDIGPTFYFLQIIYYLASMMVLLLGLGWMTSSSNLFIKDVSKIVAILVQFGFWLTPIFWNIQMIPEKYHWLIKLNPMYYIVTGYRDSIIYKIPFWSKPYETLYFWLFTSVITILGIFVFRKLRPHFAEVV